MSRLTHADSQYLENVCDECVGGCDHLSLHGPLHSFSPHGFLMRIICSFSDLKKASSPWPSRTFRTSVTAYAWPLTRPQSSRASMSSIVVAWVTTRGIRLCKEMLSWITKVIYKGGGGTVVWEINNRQTFGRNVSLGPSFLLSAFSKLTLQNTRVCNAQKMIHREVEEDLYHYCMKH